MEQPIVNAIVIVLKYNMSSGQWVELGSQAGPCNISIFKSTANEYRFVSWKESNNEVVLNSFLFPTMNYNETTPTFHQWYDENKNAHGLNFTDTNEAKKFGIAVVSALEILNQSKTVKPIIDSIPTAKKSVENKSPGYRSTNRKVSVDRPQNNPTVSPYAMTGINQISDSSTVKVPAVPTGKPTSGAPPPPGPPPNAPAAPPPPCPPPSGPAPPGLPPSAPTLSVKKTPANDFASQLKTASQNMKSSAANSNTDSITSGPPPSSTILTTQAPSKAAPMDFLSELRLKSQKRSDGTNQIKRNDPPKASPVSPAANITSKNCLSQPTKLSSSNSDLTASFVTSADLEKFRIDLMQEILVNMEKMKSEIILGIISKLN